MSRILIVEDEDAIRRVLSKIILNEDGEMVVEEAKDGAEGYEMIQKTDYDLVLCDIKMPKMDGVEVLQKVQEIKPEIPFIRLPNACSSYWVIRNLVIMTRTMS